MLDLLSAVGAGEVHFGEVSADIYAESLVYVDCMSNAEHELVGLPAPIAGELGGVIIHGNYPDEQAVTIFQSMGELSRLNIINNTIYAIPSCLSAAHRNGLRGCLCGRSRAVGAPVMRQVMLHSDSSC